MGVSNELWVLLLFGGVATYTIGRAIETGFQRTAAILEEIRDQQRRHYAAAERGNGSRSGE